MEEELLSSWADTKEDMAANTATDNRSALWEYVKKQWIVVILIEVVVTRGTSLVLVLLWESGKGAIAWLET